MAVLNSTITYLAGPIDKAKDLGVGWRKEFRIKAEHFGIKILDPTHKPNDMLSETAAEQATIHSLRSRHDWEGMTRYIKKIRHLDLRFVDLCDFVIAYVDPTIHMCGTYHEIFLASQQEKPILLIVNGGLDAMPAWLFSVVNYKEVFASIDDCIAYLDLIDRGIVNIDDRWVLIRNYLNK